MCIFIGWQTIFGLMLYSFLNAAIGVNLHLLFLKNTKVLKNVETLYWQLPIALGLVISLPPYCKFLFCHYLIWYCAN